MPFVALHCEINPYASPLSSPFKKKIRQPKVKLVWRALTPVSCIIEIQIQQVQHATV